MGRLVDVEGVPPDRVLFAAATQEAYGDDPWERTVLIAGWVGRGECTAEEVAIALDTARGYMLEDPFDYEAARAVVVLAKVVRDTYREED